MKEFTQGRNLLDVSNVAEISAGKISLLYIQKYTQGKRHLNA